MSIYALLVILWGVVIPTICFGIFLIAQRMNRSVLPETKWCGRLEVYVFGKGRVTVHMLFTETIADYVVVALERLDLPYEADLFSNNPPLWEITSFDRQRAKLIVHLT